MKFLTYYEVIPKKAPLQNPRYFSRFRQKESVTFLVEDKGKLGESFVAEIENIEVRYYVINGQPQYVALPPELLEIFKLEEGRFQQLEKELAGYKYLNENLRADLKYSGQTFNKYRYASFWQRLKYLFRGYIDD